LGRVSKSDEFQDHSISLTFAPAILPTAEVLGDAGAESTGGVWAGLVGDLCLELDAEAELVAANGTRGDLQPLQTQLEPLLTDESALTGP
jgi:hypothetical protein